MLIIPIIKENEIVNIKIKQNTTTIKESKKEAA